MVDMIIEIIYSLHLSIMTEFFATSRVIQLYHLPRNAGITCIILSNKSNQHHLKFTLYYLMKWGTKNKMDKPALRLQFTTPVAFYSSPAS
jgi:hypothetical protein